MQNAKRSIIVGVLAPAVLALAVWQSSVAAKASPYPARAPLAQYLMPEAAEVALARSAAPPSISTGAEVMVLGPSGYRSEVAGRNGFVCLVERSWGAATDDPQFWNPHIRGPACFNPPAAHTVLPAYLAKTKWVLAGKSSTEIVRNLAAAFDRHELPPLAPGAMCYMLSKRQYLGDQPKRWHPHLMFFVAGDAAKSWGADLPGSPVMAANDPEERMTIMMVWAGKWSDGTRAPRF